MNSYKVTTLNDFIILKQKDFPFAKGELSSLQHQRSPFYAGSKNMVRKIESFLAGDKA